MVDSVGEDRYIHKTEAIETYSGIVQKEDSDSEIVSSDEDSIF